MKKIVPEYIFSEEQLNKIAELSEETGLTEHIVRILYARGVDDAEKFTNSCTLPVSTFFLPCS